MLALLVAWSMYKSVDEAWTAYEAYEARQAEKAAEAAVIITLSSVGNCNVQLWDNADDWMALQNAVWI